MKSDKLWILAVFLNCFGSIIVNFSANLIKLAHNDEKADAGSGKQDAHQSVAGVIENSPSLRQPIWRIGSCFTLTRRRGSRNIWRTGMLLFIMGSLINFVSLGLAAQSLLAVLGGVQFISNIFFAKCLLNEDITTRRLFATSVIIVGLTVAVCFSSHSTHSYTITQLVALYDGTYIAFLCCIAVCLVLAEATYRWYTRREIIGKPLPGSSVVRPVTYSLVSATVGTQSVLQSKCLAELVYTWFAARHAHSTLQQSQVPETAASVSSRGAVYCDWLFYVILVTFVTGLSFWLHRLNNALRLFDGIVIIPVLQVFWTTSAILQGGMFFKEFQGFTAWQSWWFFWGVMTVLGGVYLMAASPSASASASVPSSESDTSSLSSNVSLHHPSAPTPLAEGVDVPHAMFCPQRNRVPYHCVSATASSDLVSEQCYSHDLEAQRKQQKEEAEDCELVHSPLVRGGSIGSVVGTVIGATIGVGKDGSLASLVDSPGEGSDDKNKNDTEEDGRGRSEGGEERDRLLGVSHSFTEEDCEAKYSFGGTVGDLEGPTGVSLLERELELLVQSPASALGLGAPYWSPVRHSS